MTPLLTMKRIGRLEPGRMLDIGSRDFFVARQFIDAGYEVHAIDPAPLERAIIPEQVAFQKTRLEDFDTALKFDLVVASMVSMFVSYELDEFLKRLADLATPAGYNYVTLLGDEDDWAGNSKCKAISFREALALIDACGLRPMYQATEYFDGSTYDGTPKAWHIHTFVTVDKRVTE